MARKGKTASRKVRDKWKAKEWYKIYAPPMFNQALLGETPSSDPATLIGRTTEATVHDLTGDFSKMHVKLKFRIEDVRGYDAHTVFIGQDLTSDYVRRLTRRKRTKTDHVVDVRTKDGYLVRLKPMSIAERRIQSSQESAIRALMTEYINKTVPEMTMSDLAKAIISGELAKEMARVCKAVVPIKRMEVRKTEVLEMGEPEPLQEESEESAEEEADGENELIEEELAERSSPEELSEQPPEAEEEEMESGT